MNIRSKPFPRLAGKNRAYLLVAAAIAALALLKFVLVSLHHGSVLDSDKVAQFLLLKDIFSSKIFFPPDSFFLQFPLYLVVEAAFGYSRWTIITVTFVHQLVCFSGFVLLYVTLFRQKVRSAVYFLPLIWIFSQSELFFYYVGYPSSRGLEVGLYCVFIALLIKIFSGELAFSIRSWIFWVSLAIMSFMFFSDPYWGYMLTIPTLLVYVLASIRNKKAANTAIPILMFLVLFIALVLRWILGTSSWFFFYSSDAVFVDYAAFLKNIGIFLEGLLRLFDAFFFRQNVFSFPGIAAICNLVLLLSGIYGLWRLYRGHTEKQIWYGIFFITFVVIVLSYIFSNKIIDLGSTRYLLLLPFLVAIGLAHLVTYVEKSVIYLLVPVLSAAVVLNISASGYLLDPVLFDRVNGQSASLVGMLEEKNLRYGYGNYWLANVNTFFSQEKVTIRQVVCSSEGRMVPYRWLSAERWYDPASYQGETFLIAEKNGAVGGCSAERLARQFGDPSASYDLDLGTDTIRILVYPYNISSKF